MAAAIARARFMTNFITSRPDLGIERDAGYLSVCGPTPDQSGSRQCRQRLSAITLRRPSRRTFRRRGHCCDLGLPVAAKCRLVDLAVDDMDAPVGPCRQCRVVRNNHYGLAAVGDIAQNAEHLLGRSGVEISGRLVGDNDFGTVGERPRQRYALPLTAGKLIGPLAGLLAEAERRQQATRSLFNFL